MQQRMTLLPLGTSAGVPTPKRNVSAFAAAFERAWILFDCGEGTQYRLLSTNLKWERLEAILISHLHGDHVYGLPGLLGTLEMRSRKAPLKIVGPPGIREFLSRFPESDGSDRSFDLEIIEAEPGEVFKSRFYQVDCAALDHRVPTLGYAVREFDSAGRGTPGRKIVYCCDTRPCSGSIELSRGADVLIHEATYTSDLTEQALARGHSTAAHAAGIALKARARKLLITHYSPRYLDTKPLLEEARSLFPSTEAAEDLQELEVPRAA